MHFSCVFRSFDIIPYVAHFAAHPPQNGYSVLVADPLAIKNLLIDGPDGFAVHKPPFNRQTNERLLGKGVIWAEGEV